MEMHHTYRAWLDAAPIEAKVQDEERIARFIDVCRDPYKAPEQKMRPLYELACRGIDPYAVDYQEQAKLIPDQVRAATPSLVCAVKTCAHPTFYWFKESVPGLSGYGLCSHHYVAFGKEAVDALFDQVQDIVRENGPDLDAQTHALVDAFLYERVIHG